MSSLRRIRLSLAVIASNAVLSANMPAQSKVLRVLTPDSTPVAFAWVSVAGGPRHITDENGRTSVGAFSGTHVVVSAVRIGYQPWMGKIPTADTTHFLTVVLTPLAQSVKTVQVTGAPPISSHLRLTGFYDRAMMREKGLLSAVWDVSYDDSR